MLCPPISSEQIRRPLFGLPESQTRLPQKNRKQLSNPPYITRPLLERRTHRPIHYLPWLRPTYPFDVLLSKHDTMPLIVLDMELIHPASDLSKITESSEREHSCISGFMGVISKSPLGRSSFCGISESSPWLLQVSSGQGLLSSKKPMTARLLRVALCACPKLHSSATRILRDRCGRTSVSTTEFQETEADTCFR